MHLDGSIRLDTIIDLAKEQKIKLPSYTASGLEETLFKDHYNSLDEYLKTFGYSCSVMQTPESLERIAYELAIDCQDEGLKYIEVRMDPLLVTNSLQSHLDVFKLIDRGLKKAQKEYNQKIKTKEEPPFHYAIIVCILRSIINGRSIIAKFLNLCLLFSKTNYKSSFFRADSWRSLAREKDIPVVALI